MEKKPEFSHTMNFPKNLQATVNSELFWHRDNKIYSVRLLK